MLTDLSWFKSLKWILGISVAFCLILWFFLFQFPYYHSFTVFLEEQFLFLAGMFLLTLLGFQVGFLPVEQFIKRQSDLNLYLQRIKRLGQSLSQVTDRATLIEKLTGEIVDLFPYEGLAIYHYRDGDDVLEKVTDSREGLDQIKDREFLTSFKESEIVDCSAESHFAVWDWPHTIACPVSGLSGPTYLLCLKTDENERPFAFHRILGRMLAEQIGEGLRHIEQLEREQSIQQELNEEIERNTQEIRQQRQFLSSILDSLKEGLIVIDRDGRIQRINPTALELLDGDNPEPDIPLSDLSGHLPAEMLNDRDRTRTRTIEHEGRTFEYEWQPVENSDYRLLVFRDRTELEKLEEQLRINETLSTLGEMAGAVVHELRNPLGGMEIYLGLLKRKYENPELDKPIRQLEEGFKAIQNTTETLLNYTKTSHPTPEEIDPNQLMDSVLEQCRETIENHDVAVENTLPDLPTINGDFEQLHSVFVNLIRNGIEAQDNDRRIELFGEAGDDWLEISIRDDGKGMDEEECEKVFNRFFTTKQDGTGLGLAICKRMVEVHSGEISVTSTPDEGSTFTVKLPVEPNIVEPERESTNE